MSTDGIEDWELLGQMSQAYRTLLDTMMAQIDMHRAQAVLLCRLFEQDGMTQSEIGDQLGVQGATVTNIVQRMEETGLVNRHRDVEDNRLVRVYLTDMGRQKERAIYAQFARLEEQLFANINEQDRLVLRRTLQQMLKNINPVD